MNTRILIVVNKGIVTDVVCTDQNAKVTMIDWDSIRQGQERFELADDGEYPSRCASDEEIDEILRDAVE